MSKTANDVIDPEKREYRQILNGKCIRVGDCWFPTVGAGKALREYRHEIKRKAKRNRRRRELRRARKLEAASAILTDRTTSMAATSVRIHIDKISVKQPQRDDSPVQRMVENAQWQLFHRPSYELLVHPSEVLTLVLLFDLVGFLDRVVRHLLRQALERGEKTDDPEIAHEAARIANERPLRRYASDAPLDTLHRLACERRKALCRSTVAECPTATDVRVAWHFRKRSYKDLLELGGLLLDLECYLDNSLRREMHGGRPLIKGRNPGLRGWLRENCPELIGKYFTLMRCKGVVRRLRQALDVPDPVPTSALMDDSESAAALQSRDIHVQSRGTVLANLVRFPWEHGEWRIDARGRRFLTNNGYENAPGWTLDVTTLDRHLAETRRALQAILNTARDAAARSATNRHSHMAAIHLCREILRRVNEREIWWRTPLTTTET